MFEPIAGAGGVRIHRKGQLLGDRHMGKQAVVLRHVADLAPLGRQRVEVRCAEAHHAVFVLLESCDQAQRQRLAGAGRPNDREAPGGRCPCHVEVEGPEMPGQLKRELERGGFGRRRLTRGLDGRILAVFQFCDAALAPAVQRQRGADNGDRQRG